MLRVAEEFHATHTGRQRRANEDSLYARAPLFAVADGMGGAQAGEIASQIAVETLGSGVPEGGEAAEHRLAELIRTANARIFDLARSDDRRAGMGTTMTVVLVGEDEITLAHVGDSRAYRLRDGDLERLTRDHSLVEELLAQGKLTPEEASHHPQRSVITRAVGPEAGVEVDTQTSKARDGDVFLICSDGLTTMVDEASVRRMLTEAPSLEDAGHALIDAANDAGGRDNITVVLFRVADVGAPALRTAAPGAAEQPTTASGDALRVEDVHAEMDRAPGAAAPTATLERSRTDRTDRTDRTGSRRLPPVAAEPPPPPPGRGPRRRRGRRALVAFAVAGIIGVPLLLGGLIALRAVYFVGTNGQGFVTVYRGVPYELPLGIELYQENYVSPVAGDRVPAGSRPAVTDQELRSQEDAYDLVRRLELGQLQGSS